MITIGETAYPTSRPADLDAAIAATGITAAEMATALAGQPQASHLATALHPFLAKDAPPVQELAMQIAAAEDREPLRAQIAKLYEPAAEKAE